MKKISLTLVLLVTTFICIGQKLPNIQRGSFFLNKNKIIDGRAIEIAYIYRAYNPTISSYYVIENDETKLYLTLNIKDVEIIKKAIGGGVTFSVTPSGKRSDPNSYGLTYPQMFSMDKSEIAKNINNITHLNGDTTSKNIKADSITIVNNRLLTMYAKKILLTGITAIPDTLISVYNEYGIRAAMNLDRAKGLTYEIAIPLKYLNIKPESSGPFLYNIMLNGVLSLDPGVIKQTSKGPALVQSIPRGFFNTQTYKDPALIYPTDFWGEYTLAKK